MTLFWILSTAMIMSAIVMVAPSLLRRPTKRNDNRERQNVLIARERLAELDDELNSGHINNEDYTAQKVELEQALSLDTGNTHTKPRMMIDRRHGRMALLATAVFVPLMSVSLYHKLGNNELIDKPAVHQNTASTQQGSPHAGSLQQMAAGLRKRLEEKTPNDGNGWFLLGRTYMTMKDYPSAVDAFNHSYQLMSNDPGVMLALADALSMTRNGSMHGRPAELVEKALKMDPENTTAMWMGGLVAEDKGDYPRALTLWQHLLPRFAGAPEEQQQLNRQIARVSMKAGLPVPQNPMLPAISNTNNQAQAMTVSTAPAGSPGITLKVSLSPDMKDRVGASDTVFIYAKAMQGPRFPLAAVRYKVSDLPITVTLDDSSAVMPAAKLSDFSSIKVGARISHSGNAIAQSGDIIGEQENVQTASTHPVDIMLSRVY